jgi:hypothetical protein
MDVETEEGRVKRRMDGRRDGGRTCEEADGWRYRRRMDVWRGGWMGVETEEGRVERRMAGGTDGGRTCEEKYGWK